MSTDRLPLVIVSGYLGAGKTTLINRLLTEDHGLRLLVLVNDFGAINIDAGLIEAAGGDTIALTNGCVCCTMGADLFMALGDALDRQPRPDALVVEASGIADPARIAEAAKAEPDLTYSGIVTVVDGDGFAALAADEMIGAQVHRQVACADLVIVRGRDRLPDGTRHALAALTTARVIPAEGDTDLAPLLFGLDPRPVAAGGDGGHADYAAWHVSGDRVADRRALDLLLAARPRGLFRIKGQVKAHDGSCWEVQVVGQRVVVRKARADVPTRLVGVGPASELPPGLADAWWAARDDDAAGPAET